MKKIIEILYRTNPEMYNKIKNISMDYLNVPKSTKAERIKSINIEITAKCNLRCPFCWWWGEYGIGKKQINYELSKEDIFSIIDDVEKYKPTIYLSGGEPFIRRDIIDILKYISGKNLEISLTTNGTLLNDEIISEIFKIKKINITFSIDGIEAVHDSIRGKGVYNKAINNIRKIIKYKKENGYDYLTIATNTTISKYNLSSLERLVNFLDTLGLDSIRLQHLWYIEPEVAKINKKVIYKKLKLKTDDGTQSHIMPAPNEEYINNLINLYERIVNRIQNYKTKVVFYPFLNKEEIKTYYSSNLKYMHKFCISPWNRIVIKSNGDVVFCPDNWIKGFKLGNVHKNKITEIWNNDKAQKFRKNLLEGGFPCCKRCCYFYSRS